MDGLSFHPYPNRATDPLDRGYRLAERGVREPRPRQAGDLGRLRGHPQPTTLEGLSLYLDEVGWQVDTSRPRGIHGRRERARHQRGDAGRVYGALVRTAACDPDVAAVNLFGFRDDALRTGFQAGLERVDGTPRPSLAAVRDAIAASACATGGAPTGVPLARCSEQALQACASAGARSRSASPRARARPPVPACSAGRTRSRASDAPSRPCVRSPAPQVESMRTARRRSSSAGARVGRPWRFVCRPTPTPGARRLSSVWCRLHEEIAPSRRSSVRRHPRNSQDLSTTRRSAALTRSPRRPERSPFLTLRASRISPRC